MDNDQSLGKSKLFKLKEWLTIPETANHLSIMFGEEVKEADVLRLALDRHLKVSVNFVNHAYAKPGAKFLPYEQWEIDFRKSELALEDLKAIIDSDENLLLYFSTYDVIFPFNYPEKKDKSTPRKNLSEELSKAEELKKSYLRTLSSKEQKTLLNYMTECIIAHAKGQAEKYGRVPPSSNSFTGNAKTLKGVCDLPMLGAECLDLEHEYQQLTGGPEVTLTNLDGAFVEGKDNLIYQLQETFDKEYFKRHQDEEWKKKRLDFYANILKKRLSKKEIDEKEAAKLLEQRKQDLSKPINYNDNFYPAGSLPDDSVLVVRTQALIDLQESLSSKESTKGTLSGAPYLDTCHAFCAKELRIAIEAWTELYEKKPPKYIPQGGHKRYIIKWLEEKHPDLGQRARERIATVINPNPRGGASPIDKKN